MEPFALSILLTKAEYTAEAVRQAQRIGWMTPAGMVLVLIGTVAGLWELLSATASWGLVMLGVLLMLCEWLFIPMMARVQAAARYDREPPEAVAVTFLAESLQVKSSRAEGTLPYSLLTAAAENDEMFCLAFGAEFSLCVPKRLLTASQAAALRGLCAR